MSTTAPADQTQQTEKKEKLLDLSVPQLGAGALAAVTAAVLGSNLGVAGTLGGAAAASVVTSVSSALYQRGLERGREKVKTVVVPRTGQNATARNASRAGAATQAFAANVPAHRSAHVGAMTPPGTAPLARPYGARPGVPNAAGSTSRQIGPYAPPTSPFGAPVPPHGPPRQRSAADPEATRMMSAAGTRPAVAYPGAHSGPAHAAEEPVAPSRNRRSIRWLAVVLGAAAVFAVAMIAVTGFEAASGEPLGSSGGEQRGTSVGQVLGGDTGAAQPEAPQNTEAPPVSESAPTPTEGAEQLETDPPGFQNDEPTTGNEEGAQQGEPTPTPRERGDVLPGLTG